MLRVGLTGGIGSGKSTVAAELTRLGARVIDADRVAREVVEPGTPALAAIAAEFGSGVRTPAGALDRAGLAALVFPDPERLRALEAITGPAIGARVAELRTHPSEAVVDVYDMPLLVEKGLWVHEHLTIVVGASEATRLDRLVAQRGLPERDARARIAAQATDAQRRTAADVWLDNEGAREDTAAAIDRLWQERLLPYAVNLRDGIRAKRPDRTHLVSPDPAWAAAGARVVARLAAALPGQGVDVQHIGSTSVPGLLAKPVIDVQVGVRTLAAADAPAFRQALRWAGYVLQPDRGQDHPHPSDAPAADWQKRFYGGCDPGQYVHVHVREISSPSYEFALAFRDWLRAEPAAREEYAALKERLAAAHPVTRAYSQAKEPWFDAAYGRVQAWIEHTGWRAHGHG